MKNKLDVLLTGLQPSGSLTIGNYSGGIKQILDYQNSYETFLFVPDMHATTVTQDPNALRTNIKSAVGYYLACGVDPSKPNMHIYIQSENLYHANLSWILECNTPFGELTRMHQFKEKSKQNEKFTCGLFTYPVLMASDILLYDAKYVPTGVDQKQHVELARNLAIGFNKHYNGDWFVIPEPLIPKIGGKIRDLQNPEKKMSKSTKFPKASIFLSDSPDAIRKKIMSAKTDSEGKIAYDEEHKPGVSNLISIYSVFNEISVDEVVKKFENAGYGDLKKAVAELLSEKLTKFQDNYNNIMKSSMLDDILDAGRKYTMEIAKEKYEIIRKVVGYGRL